MKLLLFALLAVAALFGCSPAVYTHGIPNLVQVEPRIWRSGQPTTAEQWQYLKSIGITRVVKLNFQSEGSDYGATAAGMTVHILSIQPEGDKDIFDNILNTFVKPDPARLVEIETAIELGGGVLVHCTHGQDRTGLAIGRYRVLYDGWSKDAAYAEMLANNFHPSLHGLHESWEDFEPSVQGDQ
jgi:protein tyrosine/serine phosphatase